MLPPTVNARGKIDNGLRAVWLTLCFQAWLWTNSATLILRTDINEDSQILAACAFGTHTRTIRTVSIPF
jgi:hypothetical protein